MRTKWIVLLRFLGVVVLLVAGMGSSWGRVHAVLAEVPGKSEPQAGVTEAVDFEATLGEPAEINRTPKDDASAGQSPQTVPPGEHPAAPDRTLANTPESYWTLMMSEGWEGAFPNGNWAVYDNNGSTGGNVLWDDDDFKPHAGSWSAWPANGGTDGVDPQYNNYKNDMDSWMVYGPFDLSNCADADFQFYYWNKSESGFDWIGWAVSPNGTNFYGQQISGDQSSWNYVDFDLHPYLGDTSVWLMFRFISDGSVTDIGAFIDDVTLWCYTDTTTVSWTFMVYLDGDNNLEAAAIDDFLEMSSVGSSANVDIVVQMDRIGGYSTAYDDWTDTKRYHVTAGMTPTIANAITAIGEANMGSTETLLNFIRWGRAAYPANNYAIVLWDHGSGWTVRDPEEILTKGIIYDDTNGDHIDMPELRSVLSTFTSAGAYPVELVGLDACLMAMIEVDNQLRPYADVRVGSQETEPADGWPYNTILSGLVANPSWTAAQLGTRIVDDYYTSYGNNNTQSAVNLGGLYADLTGVTHYFAQALIDWAPYYRTEITNARNAAQTFSTSTYIDLWDFADWVKIYTPNVDLDNASQSVKDAVMAAVIREQSGPSWPWAMGISIYMPKTAAEYDARYDGSSGFLVFTASTAWDQWVHVYHNLANYPANFNKSSPANAATNQLLSLTLSWGASAGATSYQYCYDTSNDNACSSWVSLGNVTSVGISGLSPSTTYYWQVRAVNATGTIYANMAPTSYWSFTTGPLPGAFNKSSPANGATSVALNPTLSWGTSSNANQYQYCIDTINNNSCDTSWISTGTTTNVGLSGLATGTTYYWHVRALNSIGTTYSNGSPTAFWSFTTGTPPGAFSKSSPSNGATFQLPNLTLSWGAASGATSYEYCVDTSNDNSCSGWTNNGSSTSVGLLSLSYGTTYYWHVRAINSFGTTYSNGSTTAFWSFTVGYPPGGFNKSSPSNGATNQPINLNLTWGASTYATSYEYCYDTSNDNACSSWVNVGSATSAPIGPLAYGTTYYWQVRAVNSLGTTYANGAATAYWAFTTGNLPGAFSKTSPSNGATGQLTSVNLNWGTSTGASSYDYCYDTTNDNACSGWTSNGAATSVSINGLSPSTTYYWHVRANNSMGTTYSNGSPTAFWSFTTGPLPGAFSKVSPGNGAMGQPLSLTLTWDASANANSYEYCYDTSNDNACSGWTSTGGATSVGISGLSTGTTYYWHVRALNAIGTTYSNGSPTAFWSFTTGSPPGVFNKISPPNGATDVSTNPSLSWGASTGAVSYEYCYDTTNDNTCSGWTSNGSSTFVVIGSLSFNTTYYWHVRAINSFGTTYSNGSATAFWSFTTGYPPVSFSKTSPSNGASNQPTSLTLSWSTSANALGYEYCYDTSNDNACSGWVSTGAATSAGISGLSYGTTYYWQVRAMNGFGITYADGAATAFWSFTVGAPPVAFNKISPSSGAVDQPLVLVLNWGSSAGATSYEYCVDTTNNNVCDGVWVGTGTNTNAVVTGLSLSTTYYWQVRAVNTFGTVYANSDVWWNFTTRDVYTYNIFMPLIRK